MRSFQNKTINQEAGEWLARLHSSDLSARDEQQFQFWINAAPEHAAAFDDATNIWDRLGGVPTSAYLAEEKTAPFLNRRAFIAGVVFVGAAGATFSFLRKAQAKEYRTAVGEQRRIPLSEGSELMLDTDTSVSVNTEGDSRSIDLRSGRLHCRVASGYGELIVNAGGRFVSGHRSVFDVSSFDGCLTVAVMSGDLLIESSGGDPIALREGDRLIAAPGQAVRRDRPDISSLTAWQAGRLIFRDETVADAIVEMNRYSTTKIEVSDPKIAATKVSGGYAVGDNLAFADSLSHAIPMVVRQVGDRVILATPPNSL